MKFKKLLIMYYCKLLFILFVTKINAAYFYDDEEIDDKTILNLKELVICAQQEAMKKRKRVGYHKINVKQTFKTSKCSTEKTVSTDVEDKGTLQMHKIWSRWGKWGGCSVTCGDGVISRRRVCVSGRCACGEFEEQRRPCIRAPCVALPEPGDDIRDPD